MPPLMTRVLRMRTHHTRPTMRQFSRRMTLTHVPSKNNMIPCTLPEWAPPMRPCVITHGHPLGPHIEVDLNLAVPSQVQVPVHGADEDAAAHDVAEVRRDEQLPDVEGGREDLDLPGPDGCGFGDDFVGRKTAMQTSQFANYVGSIARKQAGNEWREVIGTYRQSPQRKFCPSSAGQPFALRMS